MEKYKIEVAAQDADILLSGEKAKVILFGCTLERRLLELLGGVSQESDKVI